LTTKYDVFVFDVFVDVEH